MENILFSLSAISDTMIKSLSNSLGLWYILLFNAFGVIAIIIKACEFQLKTRNKILIFATSASACWIIYFFLQGDFTSALTSIVGVVQGLIFMQRGKHKWARSIFWLGLFLIIQVIVFITSFKVWHDMFSVSAGIFGTIAYFVMSEKKYRYIVLCSLICWVLNSAIKMYPIALMCDVTSTVSVIIAIIRFGTMERRAKRQHVQNIVEFVDNTQNKQVT